MSASKPPLPELVRDLKVAVQSSGLTGYQLAKKSGVTPATISRYLSGERSLSWESAARLIHALGIKLLVKPAKARKPD